MATPLPPPGTGGTSSVEREPTTLINELMMSADLWARMANENIPGISPEAAQQVYADRMLRASRLRARAARVREAERNIAEMGIVGPRTDVAAELFQSLCGPLSPTEPAATPTEKGRAR